MLSDKDSSSGIIGRLCYLIKTAAPVSLEDYGYTISAGLNLSEPRQLCIYIDMKLSQGAIILNRRLNPCLLIFRLNFKHETLNRSRV